MPSSAGFDPDHPTVSVGRPRFLRLDFAAHQIQPCRTSLPISAAPGPAGAYRGSYYICFPGSWRAMYLNPKSREKSTFLILPAVAAYSETIVKFFVQLKFKMYFSFSFYCAFNGISSSS